MTTPLANDATNTTDQRDRHPADHNLIAEILAGPPWLNAGKFATLQEAVDELVAGDYGTLFIPPGTYSLTDTLDLPLGVAGKRIVGAGQGQTIIEQTTDDIPAVRYSGENTNRHLLADLTIRYTNPQTDPDAIAILFWVSGGTTGGMFWNAFERLTIENAYDCIGTKADDGYQTIWNCRFEDITCFATKGSAVRLRSASVIGKPVNAFSNLRVINTGASDVGGNDEAAIWLQAAECQFEGLDIEGWNDALFSITGGGQVAVRGLHVEHHTCLADNPRLFYAANGPFEVAGFAISDFTLDAGSTGSFRVAHGENDGRVTLRNGKIYVTDDGSRSAYSWFDGSSALSYEMAHLDDASSPAPLLEVAVDADTYALVEQHYPTEGHRHFLSTAWEQTNVPAGTNTFPFAAGSATIQNIIMPRPGSVTGLSVSVNATPAAGAGAPNECDVVVLINGSTGSAFKITLTPSTADGETNTVPVGVKPYNAGDQIGILLSSDANWDDTVDVVVMVEVTD